MVVGRDELVVHVILRWAVRPHRRAIESKRAGSHDQGRGALGQFASPYFVLGRLQRSTYIPVRLALQAPSGLVWLATLPRARRPAVPADADAGLFRSLGQQFQQ